MHLARSLALALTLVLALTSAGSAEPDCDGGAIQVLVRVVQARYVANTRFEDLPADVVEMTKRALLDAIGVSLAASGLEPACKPFIELATESADRPEAAILGTGRRTSAALAALAQDHRLET